MKQLLFMNIEKYRIKKKNLSHEIMTVVAFQLKPPPIMSIYQFLKKLLFNWYNVSVNKKNTTVYKLCKYIFF